MPSIVRYSPWSMLRNIQEDMNQLFNKNLHDQGISQWSPHVDITEESDKYRLIADIPGVKPQAIKLNIEGDRLTIQGERKTESKKENEGYSRIERYSGTFYRQFTLPDNVNVENIQAKNKHGVLEITLPKKESSRPKSLEVRVEEE